MTVVSQAAPAKQVRRQWPMVPAWCDPPPSRLARARSGFAAPRRLRSASPRRLRSANAPAAADLG